jgi:mannose-6-phosphate isomerase-like protein (cupin superfamily)
MPDYTLKNMLRDVPDAAAERGGDIEARFARSHIDSEHLGISLFRYGANFRAPFGHRHREQEEVYVVISGSGRVRLEDEVVELAPWDVLRVAPAVARGFEAGPDGLEIVAVGNDRPEGGDGEMLPEFWPPDA